MSLFKSLFGPSKEEKEKQTKLEREKKEKDEQIKLEKEKKEKDEQIKLEKEKKERIEKKKLKNLELQPTLRFLRKFGVSFSEFIKDYRKLKKSDKTFLNNNSNYYYKKTKDIIKDSKLFKKTKYGYDSKEKLSIDYCRISKKMRNEPLLESKLEITFGGYETVPSYNMFGKRDGVKYGDPKLDLSIRFEWREKYLINEEIKSSFRTTNQTKEGYDRKLYGGDLTQYSSWKDGIVNTIEKETKNKSYLSEKEKTLFDDIEDVFTTTTIELLKKKYESKQEVIQVEKEKYKILQNEVSVILKEFDKDNDGLVDFNQGEDDFMKLLKKHQKTIIEHDKNHITKFIQISNYLKNKRENIQFQFQKISKSKKINEVKKCVGVLKNQMDTFNLLNYNSLIMIISIVEDDLITFNEIYLTLDKLNIFNSNWENQVSDKLNNIDSKLDEVIYSINKMELSIVNEILNMSIMNQVQMNRLNKNVKEGNMIIDENLNRLNSSLSSNLKSIDSTLKVGNLISTINTYQNYKINKNTKSLRG